MFCSECGAKVTEGAVFCEECGAALADFPLATPSSTVSRSKSAVGRLTGVASLGLLVISLVWPWMRFTYRGIGVEFDGYEGSPATSARADLIDSVLVSGTKAGYTFTNTAGSINSASNILTYAITAVPVAVGATGQRGFFTDQTGVIRFDANGLAGSASPPLQ